MSEPAPRFAALKLLAPEREKDPQFSDRISREAQALARLDHPHIVTVYDFGQANGFFYLLMEFVDGVNLRELPAVATQPPLRKVQIDMRIDEIVMKALEKSPKFR